MAWNTLWSQGHIHSGLAVRQSCVRDCKNLVLDNVYAIHYTPRSFGRPHACSIPRQRNLRPSKFDLAFLWRCGSFGNCYQRSRQGPFPSCSGPRPRCSGSRSRILFLLRFLRPNDEREQQINYRALTFAFAGTLVFSLAIGYSQAVSFHSVSWLGIPALMVVLWSVGLILYSWRYR
jgi:hypothetical protein